MNSLLRTTALVLGFAGITMTASAQYGSRELVAMTLVESTAMASTAQAEAVAATVEGVEADAAVVDAVERVLAEGAPELKVIRTVLTGEKWNAKLNELGLPKSETRRGVVVYYVPGMDPVVRQIAVERPYFPTSKSAMTYSVRLGKLE
jgi:hypothetical protein